jgi:DNA-binding MarR family transcriptional regulator
MTRWLSADQQQTWRLYLEVIARQMELFDQDLQHEADLALTDYEILVMLSEAEGHQLRMSELANLVIVSRSRLTYRVDRLCKRDLIERVGFADDRRGVLARLTDAGMELLERTAPHHVETVNQMIFDHIDEAELETFRSILQRMADACRLRT